MTTLPDWLEHDIHSARLPRDERGLVPLDDARALLRGTNVATRDELGLIEGTMVLQGDRVWAALLSLADADEFADRARKIHFKWEGRGFDNTSAFDRYGDDVLPWIARAVSDDGVLVHVPWLYLPALYEVGTREAYAVARRIKEVRHKAKVPAARSDEVAEKWVARRPAVGIGFIVDEIAAGGDVAEAEALLKTVAKVDPPGVRAMVAERIGEEAADALLKRLRIRLTTGGAKLKAALQDAEVADVAPGPLVTLLQLDAAFVESQAPAWDNANSLCGAMRVTGYAHPTGDALVFQSLMTGFGDGAIRREIHAFGPAFSAPGSGNREDVLIEEDALPNALSAYPEADGVRRWEGELGGVAVTVPIDADKRLRKLVTPPGAVLFGLGRPPVRERAFLDAAALRDALALPGDAEALFALDGWAHPDASEPASGALDLRAMTEALRLRRRLTSWPKGRTEADSIKRRFRVLDAWEDDPAAWK